MLAKLFGSLCVMLLFNYINNVSVSSGHSTISGVGFIQHLIGCWVQNDYAALLEHALDQSPSREENSFFYLVQQVIQVLKQHSSYSSSRSYYWRLPLLMKYCVLHQMQWPAHLLKFYFCLFSKFQMTLYVFFFLPLRRFSSRRFAMGTIYPQFLGYFWIINLN